MVKFLQLNKHKLWFIIGFTSSAFSGIVLLAFALAYLNGVKVPSELIFQVLLAAALGTPALILLIGFLGWSYRRWQRKTVYSKHPFSLRSELGFDQSLINNSSKWKFTEEILPGRIDSFLIRADIAEDKSNILRFTAAIKPIVVQKEKYRQMEREFKILNIEFLDPSEGICKTYNYRRAGSLTIDDIKRDLQLFTRRLRSEGFEPNDGWA